MVVRADPPALPRGPAQEVFAVADQDRHPRRLHVQQVLIARGAIGHAAVEAGLVEQPDGRDRMIESICAGQLGKVTQGCDAGRAAANDADDHCQAPWWEWFDRERDRCGSSALVESWCRWKQAPGPAGQVRADQAARTVLRKFSTSALRLLL